MRVILFSIGDFQVRSYGLVVALAIMLAMGVAYYLAKGTTYRKHIPNMMFYVLIGAILVARIWHVFFFQWDYYSKHLVEIPAIWNGGIAIQGALVGGFIAAAIYARVARISFWELADTMAPAIIFGQAIGRIACFFKWRCVWITYRLKFWHRLSGRHNGICRIRSATTLASRDMGRSVGFHCICDFIDHEK